MSLSKITGLILGSAALVAGHGYVSGIVVDDTYYGGYIITEYPYESDPPELIAWSEDETDLGYIDGSEYANSNIICHKDAKAAALEAPVKAGGSVELQWTTWPSSHHGPVITYMANCNGDCADVDKATLQFFKIDQGGLISDTDVPGTWATDNLISNNNSRTVTVPSDIADGNYVLRHEIIALHSAEETNGAQNYPQCINLKVTGGGSATPSGTLGTALYKNTDPGILINIYTSLSTYDIPGPTLYTAGAAAATTASTAVSTTAVSTTAVATTSAEVTSTPASVESVVPTTTPIASVSASPTRSPSFTPPFSNSTRAWRPTFSRQPSSPSFTSVPAQFTAPSAAEQHQTATATPTVITLTETSTSWVTELVTLTDKSVVQTTSAVPVAVAVTTTVTEGSEPTQTSSASVASGSTSSSGSGSGSGSESSGSGSGSTSSSSSSTSAESDYVSSDWTSYLSSLSASEVLQLLRQTFKWLVSNDKVHARDISISN